MEDAPELFVTPESEQSEAVAVSGNVQALLDLMARNPLHREIYLQIIEFCEVRRLLGDVEAMVADCSGFSLTAQTPFRLIAMLWTTEASIGTRWMHKAMRSRRSAGRI